MPPSIPAMPHVPVPALRNPVARSPFILRLGATLSLFPPTIGPDFADPAQDAPPSHRFLLPNLNGGLNKGPWRLRIIEPIYGAARPY